MNTKTRRRFYCQKCDGYTLSAYTEIPLRLIVELAPDHHTVIEDPRCTAVNPDEIDLNKLDCPSCGERVVVKTGEWKFVPTQQEGAT